MNLCRRLKSQRIYKKKKRVNFSRVRSDLARNFQPGQFRPSRVTDPADPALEESLDFKLTELTKYPLTYDVSFDKSLADAAGPY